jgi:hypothetical protein
MAASFTEYYCIVVYRHRNFIRQKVLISCLLLESISLIIHTLPIPPHLTQTLFLRSLIHNPPVNFYILIQGGFEFDAEFRVG